MSNSPSPHRMLHLAVGNFPMARLEELEKLSGTSGNEAEIFTLTEANAREALEKIFSADGVAVSGEL